MHPLEKTALRACLHICQFPFLCHLKKLQLSKRTWDKISHYSKYYGTFSSNFWGIYTESKWFCTCNHHPDKSLDHFQAKKASYASSLSISTLSITCFNLHHHWFFCSWTSNFVELWSVYPFSLNIRFERCIYIHEHFKAKLLSGYKMKTCYLSKTSEDRVLEMMRFMHSSSFFKSCHYQFLYLENTNNISLPLTTVSGKANLPFYYL